MPRITTFLLSPPKKDDVVLFLLFFFSLLLDGCFFFTLLMDNRPLSMCRNAAVLFSTTIHIFPHTTFTVFLFIYAACFQNLSSCLHESTPPTTTTTNYIYI